MTIGRGAVCIVGAHSILAAGARVSQAAAHREYERVGRYGHYQTPMVDSSPNIAGLEGWNHETAIEFFMSGTCAGWGSRRVLRFRNTTRIESTPRQWPYA